MPDCGSDGAERFIRARMVALPVPSVPEISLCTATPASGLAGLVAGGKPPYWAFAWAGGLALARHILDRPETVAGRHVLDLGSGSGLVAIAAARAGAASVVASETDPTACAALRINAALNDVAPIIDTRDILGEPAPDVDLLLVGDLFYHRATARRVTAFLDRCVAAGVESLVGDPGRAYLPRARLRLLAEYAVPDVGGAVAGGTSGVYRFETRSRPRPDAIS